METVATFEKVKDAYNHLRDLGERPSAGRIVAMVGGSKSTVLFHMRTLLDGFATEKSAFAPARDLLEASAATMARRLWDEANRLAERSFEIRLQTLVTMQAALFEDLKVAIDAEEAALARATLAEGRVATLEAELAARATVEQHLGMLKDFMETLRKDPELPAMAQLLALLADGRRHEKNGIYLRMATMGYEAAVVHRARYHAVTAGYVEELEGVGDLDTGLKLTASGRLKATG